MSFQWIFDRAETISINRRSTVTQSITRANRVRAVSAGGQVWRFDVRLPDGIPYSELRGLIESADAADRTTVETITMNNPGYSYINQYQGNTANIVVSYPSDLTPTQLTLTSSDGGDLGEYTVRAGDWIQLGTTGHVYSVTEDVPIGSAVIPVNRPVIESANASVTYTAILGQDCTFPVICVEFPSWTIFGYNQVSWSGSFVFYEVV